jgi:hypothetical protein
MIALPLERTPDDDQAGALFLGTMINTRSETCAGCDRGTRPMVSAG